MNPLPLFPYSQLGSRTQTDFRRYASSLRRLATFSYHYHYHYYTRVRVDSHPKERLEGRVSMGDDDAALVLSNPLDR